MIPRVKPASRGCAVFPLLLVVLFFLSASCATLRVPPVLPQAARAESGVAGRAGGVVVSARPIRNLAEYRSLFDDDLPRAGLAVLVLTVQNLGGESVDAGRFSFRLRLRGRSRAPLDSGGILKAYYKGKGIRAYAEYAHQTAQEALGGVLFRPVLLGPGGVASGLAFFAIEPMGSEDWTSGALLDVTGLPRVSGRKPTISLVLEDARP